jgi:hypothetical protein
MSALPLPSVPLNEAKEMVEPEWWAEAKLVLAGMPALTDRDLAEAYRALSGISVVWKEK